MVLTFEDSVLMATAKTLARCLETNQWQTVKFSQLDQLNYIENFNVINIECIFIQIKIY